MALGDLFNKLSGANIPGSQKRLAGMNAPQGSVGTSDGGGIFSALRALSGGGGKEGPANMQQSQLQMENQLRQSMLHELFPLRGLGQRSARRNAGLERDAIPFIQQDLMREAGTGSIFENQLSRGTEALRSSLAHLGLDSSTIFSRGVGELTSNLLAADQDRLTRLRQGLLRPEFSNLSMAGFAPISPNVGGALGNVTQVGMAHDAKSGGGGLGGALGSIGGTILGGAASGFGGGIGKKLADIF